MSLNSGKLWPYAISASIALIVCAGIATIVIASASPIQKSDTYMMDYHEADNTANEIIEAAIAFDKKYKIEYLNKGLLTDEATIKYRVTDRDSNPVDNAKIKVLITRQTTHKYDQELTNPTVKDGIYTFKIASIKEIGRWDMMAKISINNLQKFYNIKVDTRNSEVVEY